MNDSTSPLCLSCNYPLSGLESRRCPECGREFDPSDVKSVNRGRPLGAWGRSLIRPVGWPMMGAAVLAIVGLAWVTRWPGFWATFWFGDAREATKMIVSKSVIGDFRGLGSADRIFVAAVGVWWIAVIWFGLREAMRLIVLLAMRPGKMLRPRVGARRTMAVLLLCAGLVVIGFGWPYRMGARNVATTIEYLTRSRLPGAPLWPSELKNHRARSLQIARAEMSALAEPRWRLFGLADLIDGHADHALPILVEQAEREKDAGVRVAEIHLISAYRDPASAEALLKHLDAADALTRAAAIDSLGILYAPAYPIPNGENQSWSGGELRTDPSVELRNIISLVNQRTLGPGDRNPSLLPLSADPIAMPTGLRERLSGLMLNGPTVEEREAAARAMLSQPAAGYALRYAEWGVWLASDADPNLHMVPAIEEIPPFVHRMGNPVATLRDHVLEKIIIINKPVIHLTASVPMAVDLETRIHLGRPWFAYPKPDDFSVGVEAQTVGGKLEISSNEDLHNPLAALDKADLASLPDAREGHPWLLPAHRQRDTPGSNNYNSINLIKALGVRWQSAIVSPQKLSWMQPPVVPEDQRFGWWSRLREVDCSWVSSRGEAERFLYYDGPTIAPTRCEVYIDKGQLRFSPNMDLPLPGILVEVKEGKAVGTTVNIAAGLLAMDLSKLRSEMKLNAREQLLALLLKGGLKSAEAEGLLDCWAPQFFNTPGLRFIAVFGTAEYDKLCPMELRPAATERARVGLQLKEFR